MDIVDCHVHFIDSDALAYPHFQQVDASFVALVGDYSPLPRRYLPEEYLKETQGYPVKKTVMAEFISTDPIREALWARGLSERFGHPHGFIALASPSDPQFPHLLESYQKIPIVRAVREHMLWSESNSQMRFAKRPHILLDAKWRQNFALLEKTGYAWEFEIFSEQIPDAIRLAHAFPGIPMVLHPMGWSLDLSKEGFQKWKKNMQAISQCQNVILKITAICCIFRHWTLEQIRPWIREAIEIFGPSRSMFGSNMPIEKIDNHSFFDLYHAFDAITEDLSQAERKQVFGETAIRFYRL